MAVNYNDKRFTQVNNEKAVALKENETTYNNMINNSDKYYQAQIDASKDWANTQTKLQNEQTDFAIEKIEQQKDQAHKDYIKEQTGAYVDWQKQSDPYGVNAEQRASQGMANGGYAESSQVAMYTAYQNRVATARDVYNRALLNYDNSIKDARLQNKSILAEIAYKSLQQQLELALEGFQYKNTLLLDKAKTKRDIDNTYYGRYQDVLNQINTENAQAEAKRQFDENMKLQRDQFNWQKAKAASAKSSGGTHSGGSGRIIKDGSNGSSSGGSIDTATIDTKSVTALGLGPVNANALDKLVSAGYVEEYTDGGKIKFRYTSYGAMHKNDAKNIVSGKTTSTSNTPKTGNKAKDFLNR